MWLLVADADGVAAVRLPGEPVAERVVVAVLLWARAAPAVPRDEAAEFVVELPPDVGLPSSALATAGAASNAALNPVAAVPT